MQAVAFVYFSGGYRIENLLCCLRMAFAVRSKNAAEAGAVGPQFRYQRGQSGDAVQGTLFLDICHLFQSERWHLSGQLSVTVGIPSAQPHTVGGAKSGVTRSTRAYRLRRLRACERRRYSQAGSPPVLPSGSNVFISGTCLANR